jgi:3-dehydroquinate synthase
VSGGSEVHVGLGARSYVVRIAPGLVQRAGAEIADLLARPRTGSSPNAMVADLHLGP